jgi:OOP family OmpA-OmpF porin
LQLLRNGAEVSLIGLVPEAGRDDIEAALADQGLTRGVSDLLETVAQPGPGAWRESLALGLSTLGYLASATVSVTPGNVAVRAVAASDEERLELETRLRAAVPEGVSLVLDITAPRPVIAPFAVEFSLSDGVGRLQTCAAESDAAAAAILASARETGLTGEAECTIGLGAPSPDWAKAVALGFAALRDLGGGSFVLRDVDAVLTGPGGGKAERVAEVAEALEADMPPVFSLSTVVPEAVPAGGALETVRVPRFEAVLEDGERVRLSGPVSDVTSRDAIATYAAALFGYDRVINATLIAPDLPAGWPMRVLAGVEALAQLKEGALKVTPEAVEVSGWGLAEDVDAQVEALLAAKVAGRAQVDVRFDAAAAADVARTPIATCAAEVAAILADRSIVFAPGSSSIEEGSRIVIVALAEVLRGCPGSAFEIAGYTDSQGRDETNLRISQGRASAVLAALEAEGLPLIALSARGYGEDDPVADNATEEGRAENRRIAFRLLGTIGDADAEQMAARPAQASAAGDGGVEEVIGDAATAAADVMARDNPGDETAKDAEHPDHPVQ